MNAEELAKAVERFNERYGLKVVTLADGRTVRLYDTSVGSTEFVGLSTRAGCADGELSIIAIYAPIEDWGESNGDQTEAVQPLPEKTPEGFLIRTLHLPFRRVTYGVNPARR